MSIFFSNPFFFFDIKKNSITPFFISQKKEQKVEIVAQEYNPNPTTKIEKTLKIFPIWGDSSSFNLNPLLRNNIFSSQYFKDLYLLKTYHEAHKPYLII